MPSNSIALAFLTIYISICAMIYLVFYIFNSLGILFLSNKLGLKHGWFGFFPYLSNYKLGQIADECSKRMGERKNYAKVLLGFEIALSVVTIPVVILALMLLGISGAYSDADYYGYGGEFAVGGGQMLDSETASTILIFALILVLISLVIFVAAIIMAVFRYIALYKIFNYVTPGNAVLFIVLSIIFTLNWLFIFIASLKKDIPQTDEPILNGGYDYAASCVYPEQQPAYTAPSVNNPNVYMPPEDK